MSSADAHAVLVFVEEPSSESSGTVSMEDVSDWLAMVDDVESIKLQFDVATKRTCYCVRFVKASAAQQAVQYLDGVKLKNRRIDVKSAVYTKKVTPASEADQPSAQDQTEDETVYPVCAGLPHNHEVPADIRMDVVLAELLPTFTADEVYTDITSLKENLLELQRKLSQTLHSIRVIDKEIEASDALLEEKLGSAAKPSDGGCNASPAATIEAAPSLSYHNSVAIPSNLYSPLALVTHITESFGPISWCECVMEGRSETYHLSFAFMMVEDSAEFLAVVLPPEQEATKRRMESTAFHRALTEYCWGPAS